MELPLELERILHQPWLRALIIIAGFTLLALLVRLLFRRLISKFTEGTKTSLDDKVVTVARDSIIIALMVLGVQAALFQIVTSVGGTTWQNTHYHFFFIAWVFLASWTMTRLLNAIASWRIESIDNAPGADKRDIATRINTFRKVLNVIIIGLGFIYALTVTGIDMSPLVAGGALGGLVIGIALQNTLSNLFAGFFMNIDKPVKIGDYIRVDNEQEGFVEEVGWSYTKIRLWSNNIVIIPNNKISQSVIINYNLPAEPLSIYIKCGVGYESDLDLVEEVTIRVAKEVQDSEEGGDTSWTPVVRFKEFGESSINFVTVLRSAQIGAQYRIHHAFIKALHREYRKEGINIPFPIRTVILKNQEMAK